MKFGFIGYGEAAHVIAGGYHNAGVEKICAWSKVFLNDPAQAEAEKCETLPELLEKSDVVLVLVPDAAAVDAARESAPFLSARHLYVDLSTAAPADMKTASGLVEKTGARFADGAMMDTVPKLGYKVPTVLSGRGAKDAFDALTPYGACMEIVGDTPGAASAIKLLRSVYTKAHLAIAYELLEAADHFGVAEIVMNSLARTMDSKSFLDGMNGRTCSGLIHADRRSHELLSAAEMLEAEGLKAPVSRAGAEKLREIADLHVREKAGGARPDNWQEAVAWIKKYKENQDPKE
ncbi:MAG: NAD(P)-dependent oxidoreductase [Clostridia bacterium]|nr:NAD(P)-dependent oxidoreductase [Clostridia bacterium]